jgi:hypothetical protein
MEHNVATLEDRIVTAVRDELRALRAEFRDEHHALRAEFRDELRALRVSVNNVDARYNGHTIRLDDMNRRFDDMNRRLDDTNRRLDNGFNQINQCVMNF